MRSLFLVVPKAEGEVIRKNLLEMGALNKEIRIESNAETIFIPVTREVNLGFRMVEREARAIEKRPRSYGELADVPDEVRSLLPTSFDVIGEIIVVKLPEELLPFSKEIGRAMMEAYRGIRTVAVDEGVKGDFRVRKLRVIHGDDSLATVHRAYDVSLEVDLSTCYFSPRIAAETWRIAKQVKEEEVVVDMFCGVGPFALTIAKHAKPAKIHAIDSNPQAIHYLERNIARNKILNVKPTLGDSGDVMKDITDATRVIIDLPHSSRIFFEPAIGSVGKGTIHYYEILEETDVERRIEDLEAIADEAGKTVRLTGTRRVRSFSPSHAHFVLDLRVS
ncbi:MAG: class I SAM-dependent methyltransferase family protein [Thermoplasmata archaeon]